MAKTVCVWRQRPGAGAPDVLRGLRLGKIASIPPRTGAMHMADSLDTAFAAHLEAVRAHTDAALAAHRYDGLVVYSGRPRDHFLDDHAPPYKANPHFLWWAPLADAPDSFVHYVPGQRPRLVFHQPADYWHKPPALPSAQWTQSFDVQVIRTPGEARALLGTAGRRLAFIGEWQAEFDAFGLEGMLAFIADVDEADSETVETVEHG